MIQAHVLQGHFLGDTLQVYIVDHQDHGIRRLLQMSDNDGTRWVELERDDGTRTDDLAPTVQLPYDSGRTLLEALVRHYQGAEDTRQLRKDYDAERKRVDEQQKVIADIAKTLAGER